MLARRTTHFEELKQGLFSSITWAVIFGRVAAEAANDLEDLLHFPMLYWFGQGTNNNSKLLCYYAR